MKLLARARATNLGLLVLALACGWLVLWSAQLPTTAQREVRKRHLIPFFDQDLIERVEVRNGAVTTVAVRAKADPLAVKLGDDGVATPDLSPGWMLTAPFETDADQAALDKLLGTLRYATWLREAQDGRPGALADAGQLPPSLGLREVSVKMKDHAYSLRFVGESVSPPDSVYVELRSAEEAPRVFVIDKRVADAVFIDGESFRGRQIVPYKKSSIGHLVLSSAAGSRRLARTKFGFAFEGMNDDQRVQRQALDRVFLALARAVADPFVEPDVARAAFSVDSTVRLSVIPVSRDRPEASLEFGGTCPGQPDKAIALRHLPEPIAGCVDRSVLWALREPAETLIDHSPFALREDEVDRVQITQGDRTLSFSRKADGFVLTAPREAEVDTSAARDRLSRIVGLEGDLLTGRAKPRGAEQFSDIVVTLESSSVPSADLPPVSEAGAERVDGPLVQEVLRISKPRKDGARWAYRDADGAVLLLSEDGALALQADATLLKEHQVFDYAPGDVLSIATTTKTIAQTLKRDAAGGLSLVRPKGYDVDAALAVDLVDQLRGLRAIRWVSDRDSDGFGLAKPEATVVLTVNVGDRQVERTLRLGRKAPGGHYASVDRDPGVFVVARPVERAIRTWLISRAVWSADRDRIVDLTLNVQGRGRVVLRRVAGELTVQRGSANFDPGRLDELLDAVESLRPDVALHLGNPGREEGFRLPVISIVMRTRSASRVGLSTSSLRVGSRDSIRGSSAHYARWGSVNASYALPSHQVRRLMDLF